MSTFELIPSGKKSVDGPRYAVSPPELKTLIENVSKLDSKGVANALNKYKDTIPGKDATQNTFEMIALYQHAINLLGATGLTVDARFGPKTRQALLTIQGEKLGLAGGDVDGLP